jgi:hypothetical protein
MGSIRFAPGGFQSGTSSCQFSFLKGKLVIVIGQQEMLCQDGRDGRACVLRRTSLSTFYRGWSGGHA